MPRITMLLSIIALAYASWYLYANVLTGVSEAITLRSLNEQVLRVRLDVDEFEAVNEEFLLKLQGPNIDITTLRNPFKETAEEGATPDNNSSATEEPDTLNESPIGITP